jgi:hypothetical protein
MLRARWTALTIAAVLIAMLQAHACEWAIGYFYQVTALKGRVVGTNTAFLHSVRWLRQSFVRQHAKLTLYEYCSPCERNKMPLIKTVETDTDGEFDFGPLKTGHYTLIIDEAKLGSSDSFDVEVKDLPRVTESVTIDVSPVSPDCKGGHEFLVKTK